MGPDTTLFHESSNHIDVRRQQSFSCFLQLEASRSKRNGSLFFSADIMVGGKQDQSTSTELKEIIGFFHTASEIKICPLATKVILRNSPLKT